MPRPLPLDYKHPPISDGLIHLSIPLKSWKDSNPQYYALVVGGIIFRISPTSPGETEVLLLQRAAADWFPNTWEPPGGTVDLEDETILHGLVREVWEETGLRIKRVRQMVWDRNEEERKKVLETGDDGEVKFQGSREEWWCKLNFIVDVSSERELGNSTKDGEIKVDYAVTTDDEEHQDWKWCTRDNFEELTFVSEQGKDIIRNAFTAYEENLKGLKQ